MLPSEAEFEKYEAYVDSINVIYLAGPIGSARTAKERRELKQRAEYAAYVQGVLTDTTEWVVINPYGSVCYNGNFGISREKWLAQGVCIVGVIADAICLLPGWEDSPGAQHELDVARRCARRCFEWVDDVGLVPLAHGDA